jgi:hypothetical protein
MRDQSLSRDRSHVVAFCVPLQPQSPKIWLEPGTQLNRGARGLTAPRSVGTNSGCRSQHLVAC